MDVFARAGAIDWSADVTAPGLGISGSDDGTDSPMASGAQFRVWSLSLRAEYEVFDISDADTVDMISVGVTWTFLVTARLTRIIYKRLSVVDGRPSW